MKDVDALYNKNEMQQRFVLFTLLKIIQSNIKHDRNTFKCIAKLGFRLQLSNDMNKMTGNDK